VEELELPERENYENLEKLEAIYFLTLTLVPLFVDKMMISKKQIAHHFKEIKALKEAEHAITVMGPKQDHRTML